MGQFGFISSTQKRPILFPSPFSHRRQAADTVFLSSSSSLPFLFLKKIAAQQKGPSCGGLCPPSAFCKAPLVLRSSFRGKRGPPGTF